MTKKPALNVTLVVVPTVAKGVIPEGGPRFIDNRSFGGPIPAGDFSEWSL